MADNSGKVVLKNPFLDEEQQKTRKRSTNEVSVELQDGRKHYENFVKDVFDKYKPLDEISGKIAEELINYAYKSPAGNADVRKVPCKDIMDRGLTFFMSTDTGLRRTGLLSLFPALSTGIRLYSEMSESKAKTELLQKINSGIEVVFKFIYMNRDEKDEKDEDWREKQNRKPVFDASPYESDAFYAGSDAEGLEGRSYIDSISWAVTLFFKIMNLREKNKPVFDEEYRKEAKKLIKWCLSYVNNAVLTIKKKDDDSDKEYYRPVGWNFSKIESLSQNENEQRAQSSLYFTYAVASIYLSFYEEYKDVIDDLQTLNRALDKMSSDDKYDGIINALREHGDGTILLKKNDEEALKEIANYASTLKDEEKAEKLLDALEKFKKCDKRKLDEYYFFNKNKSAEYNGKIYKVDELGLLGPISMLKWNLEKISADIWEKARDLLENNFVYDSFNFNVATSEAIKSGVQTNALFAGLLHISICLYSKYDFVVSYTENDERFEDGFEKFGKKAYDDMQNIMLLHVQRAQREFDKLTKEGKAFGVDFLILRFSEKFSETDRETAERLRKQLIRVTSLTPMLLKTNNLISQYVVKYPQKQMSEAIVKIGEKRFYDRKKKTEDENEKRRWFWESDGYHAMSNYYYVGAIFDFYNYYENYEKKYTLKLGELKEKLIKDIEYTESVQAYYQTIADDKEKFKAKLEEEYRKLKDDYDKKLKDKDDEIKTSKIGDDLISNISKVVEDAIDKPEFLKKIINGLRKQLSEEVFKRYSKDPQEDKRVLEKLKEPVDPKDDSLFSLLRALAADVILQSAIEFDKEKNKSGLVREVGKGIEGEGVTPANLALNGGNQLIKDGLIGELFLFTCKNLNLKIQKTK